MESGTDFAEARRPVLWRSRLRPWLRRAWARGGFFVMLTLGFALAICVGAQAAWWTFGRSLAPEWYLGFCVPAGLLVATTTSLGVRRRGWNATRVRRAFAFAFVGSFGGLIALHLVHSPLTRFKFMGDVPVAFFLEPSFPTYREAAYTFPGDVESVQARAQDELAHAGYRVKRHGADLTADEGYFVEYPGSGWLVPSSVLVRPGRAVGHHFHIDADDLDVRHDRGWVTVDIMQPDVLPFWLRLFVP